MPVSRRPSEARTWDGFAGRYDRLVRWFDRSYPAVRQLLAEDLGGRERVLEVAAGTGQFTLALAAAAEHVLATDVSPEMVARLRARVQSTGLSNVEVAVMSAYALDLEDGAFDGVFCANALHVMERPEVALGELHRVLGPGGLLVAPTFLHGAGGARRLLSRTLSRVSRFTAHTRYDLEGLQQALRGAGFEPRRAERLAGVFPIGYVTAVRAPAD